MSRATRVPEIGLDPVASTTLAQRLAGIEVDDLALVEAAYQGEILAAVHDAAGAAFGDLAEMIAERLRSPPWLVLIRNLPPDRATPILVAVSAHLGELVEPFRRPWSRVIRQIVPARDRAVNGQAINEFLHTDGTDWPHPNDYTCLFCIRADQHGDGVSRLLDAQSLVDDLSVRADPALLERLSRPVPWRVADELGGGIKHAPVIDLVDLRVRWLRHTIADAHDDSSVTLDEDTRQALSTFEQLVESCPRSGALTLGEGDLLIIDNTRALHARSAIAKPAGSRRELHRTKVMRRDHAA